MESSARRKSPVWLALVAVVVLGVGVLTAWRILARSPYHVVLVVIDTVRRDALGCHGHPQDPTPYIDALAADGVRFDTAISTSGWTLPAIGSLVTGTWPTIHGGLGKQVVLTPLREEVPTLAEIRKEWDFTTLGFANAAFVSPMLGFDRGFDVFDHRHAFNWEIRRADETIRDALSAMRERQSEPCFVFIHLFDPHLDYDPPPGYAARFTGGRAEPALPLSMQKCMDLKTNGGEDPPGPVDVAYVKGVYQGEINFTDVHLGRLVDELKKMGIYDRTILIVTADHGEEFWEHRGFEHGHTLYDELIRIPLVVKLPTDIAAAARVVDAQVRILDVAPTILELLGIEKPESFAGESLMPLIMGQSSEDRIAFAESTLYGSDKLAWRGRRYKYIVDVNPDAEASPELYDLQNDPGETENLLAARPGVAARLRAELAEFYGELSSRAKNMSQPTIKDMSPQTIESLRSLGYIR